MTNFIKTFITDNDIVNDKPIGYESTLGWRNDIVKNLFKPIVVHILLNSQVHESIVE